MIAAGVIIILAVLVGTVVIAGALRRLVRDEADVERRVRAPNAHTISYAIPNGVDPAGLRGTLLGGGFASVVSTTGTHECLLVECEESDRPRLRHLIEGASETAYDGSELDLHHPVVFQDETLRQ
jgi:hypothetical protein